MLSDLQIVLFFVCLIVKSFKKIFMYYFAISYIIIYCITIILNILDMITNCIEFRVVENSFELINW